MAFTLDVKVKEAFFDRAKVVAAIDARERRALSRIGAFIRRRARTDILRRTAPAGARLPVGRDVRGRFKSNGRRAAAPGMPPLVRSRDRYATLRNIQFGLGPSGQSVVIGPIGIPEKRLRSSSAQTVPELMEFGGTSSVVEFSFNDGKDWTPAEPADKSEAIKRSRRATYHKHPFMGPALAKEVAAGTVIDAFATVRN